MAGIGAELAYGSDAINQLRDALIKRAQAEQDMKLRAQGADLAERQFASTEELKRAQLASLQQQRDMEMQGNREKQAQGVAESLGEPSIGQPLQASTAALLRSGNLGESVQHQSATLPSTQDQGVVAMPQLRGRIIQPSGAMSPEQGTASQGAASSIAQAGNPEQDVYRGTGPQRHAAEQTQLLRGMLRTMDPKSATAQSLMYREATGANPPGGMFRPSLEQVGAEAEARAKASAKYRQAPTVVIQTTDSNGNPITKIVPKTPGSEFAPKPTTQAQDAARTSKEALDTLSQLDQAIENAKDLIGPGEGRVSSLEQMVGNADPKIQALGVKMKAAKMRVDHAITGSVRAGASPYLMQQWDDILGNKVTPEGLKSGVQAMREILSGGASGGDVIYARDPAGQLHQAKKGTPLPAGWKVEPR